MQKKVGIVTEVFIPEEQNIDIMNSTKIGFKVKINDIELTIIQKQNEINTHIYKNDRVYITQKNTEYYDIELYKEDDYEE